MDESHFPNKTCFGHAPVKQRDYGYLYDKKDFHKTHEFEYDRVCELCQEVRPSRYEQCHQLIIIEHIYKEQANNIRRECKYLNSDYYNSCRNDAMECSECKPGPMCEVVLNNDEM
jgi:hypothetical protein